MHLQDDEKVILFPKWKKMLENESLHALKEKRYEEALSKLDELIHYQVKNHEIMTGKLICLMELGKWDEAQNLCEDLLNEEDKHYYNYVHIYLTILFQMNQFDLLMDQVTYEIQKEDLPKVQKEQFLQLYDISEKMNQDVVQEKEKVLFQQFFEAVEEGDFQEQWRQVDRLNGLQAKPTKKVIDLLIDESVHPLVKTAIVNWLKKIDWVGKITISKFDITLTIVPSEIEDVEENEVIRETIDLIGEIEHENPSLYQLLYQLLVKFTYVLYPIKPPKEDYVYIASALEIIGRESLGVISGKQEQPNQNVEFYIEKITMSESLYLSIIEG